MIIYFLKGALPWQGLNAVDQTKEQLILDKKRENTHFVMGVNDKPNYSYLRKKFICLFKGEGSEYGNVFDGKILKSLESIEQHNSEDANSAADITQALSTINLLSNSQLRHGLSGRKGDRPGTSDSDSCKSTVRRIHPSKMETSSG